MRRALLALALAALLGVGARAATPSLELLSGISFVPTRGSLDTGLGAGAEAELIGLARGSIATADAGVRVRAYRALALYPDAAARDALTAAVAEYAATSSGIETVYLRAAIDSLAVVAGSGGVSVIEPLLDHTSRDVRAAAAHALATCGSASAIPALREHLQSETVEQVRLALSAAIRQLATGP